MIGPLIILSGPSGSGKSTVMARVLATSGLPLRQSISATTRPRRDHERHGVDYYFTASAEFEKRIQAGAFLEYAKVHGHYYGTPREPVEALRQQGAGVVLVIDVQGAAQVRQRCPDHVSIFLYTSSLDVLERRLRERHTEDDADIRTRLANAGQEMLQIGNYMYRVLNDDLNAAVQDVTGIIRNSFREALHVG